MREILFRGKRLDNGEWIYGGYFKHNNRQKCVIGDSDKPEDFDDLIFVSGFADWNMPRPLNYAKVIPDTVGQYTGLKDKNGVKIFDGDIVKITDDFGDTDCIDGGIGEVCFAYGLWYVCGDVHNGLYDSDRTCWIEVIGNVYDNQDLLNEYEQQ